MQTIKIKKSLLENISFCAVLKCGIGCKKGGG
jgi:hypothetical protein